MRAGPGSLLLLGLVMPRLGLPGIFSQTMILPVSRCVRGLRVRLSLSKCCSVLGLRRGHGPAEAGLLVP